MISFGTRRRKDFSKRRIFQNVKITEKITIGAKHEVTFDVFLIQFYHNAAFDLQNCLDIEIKKNNYNNFVFAVLYERLKPVI